MKMQILMVFPRVDRGWTLQQVPPWRDKQQPFEESPQRRWQSTRRVTLRGKTLKSSIWHFNPDPQFDGTYLFDNDSMQEWNIQKSASDGLMLKLPISSMISCCHPCRDEDVLDNEGLGRKSSKRCCIFHKQRAFGESSTDSSDDENGQNSDSSSSSGGPRGNGKPIARKKTGEIKPKKVPDYQRFHA